MKTNIFTRSILLFILSVTIGFCKAQSPSCPTDLNHDGITDGADYTIFAAAYNTTCAPSSPCPTDFNSDGVTDVNDYLIFGAAYGYRCHVMIFGISNANFSGGYVNIPVSISSDATITSFDFALKFDEEKLTYDSVIPVSFEGSEGSAYFNPNDRTLRYTCSILPGSYPSNDTTLLVIRFATSATSISAADFNSIVSILNGTQSGYILK